LASNSILRGFGSPLFTAAGIAPPRVSGARRDVDEAVHFGPQLNVVSKSGVRLLQEEAAVLLYAHLLEDVQRVVRPVR
jgi:hypothetical protein